MKFLSSLVIGAAMLVSVSASAQQYLAHGTIVPGEVQTGRFWLAGHTRVVVSGNTDIDCELSDSDGDSVDNTNVCWLNVPYTGYYHLAVKNSGRRITYYSVSIQPR